MPIPTLTRILYCSARPGILKCTLCTVMYSSKPSKQYACLVLQLEHIALFLSAWLQLRRCLEIKYSLFNIPCLKWSELVWHEEFSSFICVEHCLRLQPLIRQFIVRRMWIFCLCLSHSTWRPIKPILGFYFNNDYCKYLNNYRTRLTLALNYVDVRHNKGDLRHNKGL